VTAGPACPITWQVDPVIPRGYGSRLARDRPSRPDLSGPGLPLALAPTPPHAAGLGSPAGAAAPRRGSAPNPPLYAASPVFAVALYGTPAHKRTDAPQLRTRADTAARIRHISADSSSPPRPASPATWTAVLTGDSARRAARRALPAPRWWITSKRRPGAALCLRKWITKAPPGGSHQGRRRRTATCLVVQRPGIGTTAHR